jgi:hypothetical protein
MLHRVGNVYVAIVSQESCTMINPTIDDIGRKVNYRDRSGYSREGVITSFNEFYVFVRYGNDCTSKGTQRRNLEYVNNARSDKENGKRN